MHVLSHKNQFHVHFPHTLKIILVFICQTRACNVLGRNQQISNVHLYRMNKNQKVYLFFCVKKLVFTYINLLTFLIKSSKFLVTT